MSNEIIVGEKLIDKMNRVLKVIGFIESYYVLRYKSAMPFLVHKNQLSKDVETEKYKRQSNQLKPKIK